MQMELSEEERIIHYTTRRWVVVRNMIAEGMGLLRSL